MKSTTRKRLCILSALCIAAGLLGGCGDNGAAPGSGAADGGSTAAAESGSVPNMTAAGELPIVTAPVTLNIGVFENPIVTDYTDNDYTHWLEEQTGLSFSFTLYPEGGDGQQKLDLQIASNQELPDVVMRNDLMSNKSLITYGEDGVIRNLDSCYEKYAYYFDKAMSECTDNNRKEYLARVTSTDGHRYVVPRIAESLTNDYSRCWYINKAWLDKLGLEIPKTTDELYTVLNAFRTGDPNGNGKADEIPMIGSTSWMENPEMVLLNAFLYCGELPLIANDGRVDVYYTQEAYREALRYIHRLCAEGLLSPLSFTQDNSQLKAVCNIPDGQPNLVGVFCGYPVLVLPNNTQNVLEYVAMPCLTGPEGVSYTAYMNTSYSHGTYITRSCETPEIAFRFLDFLMSEEASIRGRYGVKDVDWKYAGDSSPKSRYEEIGFPASIEIMDDTIWGTANSKVWHMNAPSFLPMGISMGEVSANTSDEIQKHKDTQSAAGFMDRYGRTPEELVPNLTYTAEEQAVIDEVAADIGTYWGESKVRFIVGDMDIEKEWDSYLQQLDTIGLPRYLEAVQSAYDRVK